MSLETEPVETTNPEPLVSDATCGADDAAAAAFIEEDLPALARARCDPCGVSVDYRPTPAHNGFAIATVRGVDADTSFGVGDDGRPICPICNATMAPVVLEAAADALTKASAAISPELPFPFNYAGAMDAIVEKNVDVQRLRDKHDILKRQAAAAKKDLDEAEAGLGALIRDMEDRRRKAERPEAQASLLDVVGESSDAQTPVCPWERAHPGERCHICRETPGAVVREADETFAAEHDEAAQAEADRALEERIFRATGRFIDASIVGAWTPDELDEVEAYLNQIADLDSSCEYPDLPAAFGRAHEAAEPSLAGDRQHCRVCGAVITFPGSTPEALKFYSPGALVGVDCTGEVEPAKEPTRTIAKRGTTGRGRKPKKPARTR